MSKLSRFFRTFIIIPLVVVLSVGITATLRDTLTPLVGSGVPYILFVLAVVFPAICFGFWAGFAATLLSILVVSVTIMPVWEEQAMVRTLLFFIVAITCSFVCGVARLNRRRVNALLVVAQSTAENERLLRKQVELARMEAERASQTKSLFLAQMSHELRSPMNAILGYTQILGEEHLAQEEHAVLLHRIKVNSDHLLHIIEDILDLSHFESGKIAIEPQLFSPQALVADVLVSFRPVAELKDIELRAELSDDVPLAISSDPARLRQILYNLVGNAIKFSDKGAVIVRIAVAGKADSAVSSQLQFEVEDAGVGLTPEQVPKLFQAFEQADNAVNRRFGGAGLGLVLSRHIAQALGGDLNLLWSRPTQGTCFQFTIALGAIEVPPLKADTTVGPPKLEGELNRLKVLLAEDSPDGAAIVTRLLKKAKAEVTLATSGYEVLSQAEVQDFDIVLMDIQMPGMDGLEATRRLRELGFTNPIVALTAHALPEEKARSFSAGCDAHLTKPVDRAALINTIRTFTKRS